MVNWNSGINNIKTYKIMKQLIISSIGSNAIIVLDLTKESIEILKKGFDATKMLEQQKFNKGVILTVPCTGEIFIRAYKLKDRYLKQINGDIEKCSPNGIEYLSFDESERIDFSKKNDLCSWYTTINPEENTFINFSKTADNGSILFEKENFNISGRHYGFSDEFLSDTIPVESLQNELEIKIV